MKMVLTGEQINQISTALDSVNRGDNESVLELHDDYWLIKTSGPSNVILVAIMMPRGQMEHYERDGYEYIGIKWEKVRDFVRNKDDSIEMWMESRTLYMDDGSARAHLATIAPEAVEGWMKSTPNIDSEVSVRGELDWIVDFIKRAESITGTDNYMVGARDEGVYLYMTGDDGSMSEFKEPDFFDEFSVNWEANNISDVEGALVPKEDHGVDAILANDFTKEIKQLDCTPRIEIANHFPLKVVYDELGDEDKAPMKVSYMQTPRVDSDWGTLPEDVLER